MMQKHSLIGCALAALVLSTGAANSQDFKVTIAGDAKFQAVFAGQDKNQNSRNVDFRNRFRLVVNPEAVGLNGALTYGGLLRMRAVNGDSTTDFDRAYIYVNGAFGKVRAGTMNNYNDDKLATAPDDWRTESDVALAFVGASKDSYNGSQSGLSAWRWNSMNPTGNNTKIRYESPWISGIQLAASYTPKAGQFANMSQTSNWSFVRTTANLTNAYEASLVFDSTDKSIADKFGDAVLQASINYQGGTNRDSAYVSQEDMSAVQGGLAVGYSGFKIGAGIVYYGKSGLYKNDGKQVNAYTFRTAAQYTTGPWIFGVGYDYSQKDVDFNAVSTHVGDVGEKKTASQISAGVMYTVSKGLQVSGEYAHITTKNTYSNLKDTADAVTLSTIFAF